MLVVDIEVAAETGGGLEPCVGIGPLAEETGGGCADCMCDAGGVLRLRPDSGKLLSDGGPANNAKGPAPGPKPARECGSM